MEELTLAFKAHESDIDYLKQLHHIKSIVFIDFKKADMPLFKEIINFKKLILQKKKNKSMKIRELVAMFTEMREGFEVEMKVRNFETAAALVVRCPHVNFKFTEIGGQNGSSSEKKKLLTFIEAAKFAYIYSKSLSKLKEPSKDIDPHNDIDHMFNV